MWLKLMLIHLLSTQVVSSLYIHTIMHISTGMCTCTHVTLPHTSDQKKNSATIYCIYLLDNCSINASPAFNNAVTPLVMYINTWMCYIDITYGHTYVYQCNCVQSTHIMSQVKHDCNPFV